MAVGGGLKTKKWIQIVSDITGSAQSYAKVKTGAAYGDALLAMLAAGVLGSPEDLKKLIRTEGSFTPDRKNYEAYKEYRKRYGSLYQATKDLMHSGETDIKAVTMDKRWKKLGKLMVEHSTKVRRGKRCL